MKLTVHTDSRDVDVEADEWVRQDDGSRVFFDTDGTKVAEFDRENFIGVTKGGNE